MDLKEMMDLNPPPKSSSQTDIVDTLVSVEDEIVNVEAEESPLEMWKSHVFFDQDTFKKYWVNLQYNNFVFKLIKPNKRVVTTK